MESYVLQPGHKIQPRDSSVSYRVKAGSAFVSLILSGADGGPSGRKTLGIAGPGTIIPGSLNPTAAEENENTVRLLVEPRETLELEEIPADAAHGNGLLDALGYPARPDNPNSRAEIAAYVAFDCRLEAEEKAAAVEKNFKKREASRERSEKAILSAYHLGGAIRADDENTEGDLLYRGMRFLCERLGIEIAPMEKVNKIAQGTPTVTDIARCSGFLCREVELEEDFYRREIAPLVCFAKSDGRPIVLWQNFFHRKFYYDPQKNESGHLKEELAAELASGAFCLHRPLNEKNPDIGVIARFALREFSLSDLIVTLAAMFLVTQMGVAVSRLNEAIYDRIIPNGSVDNLLNYGLLLAGFSVGCLLFSVSQNIAVFRQNSRIKYALQAAVFNRLFHLPEKFYRSHEAGDLTYRVGTAANSYFTLYNTLTTILLQFGFSWMYYSRMRQYSLTLARAGLAFAFFGMVLTFGISQVFLKYRQKQSDIMGRSKSFLYQVFSGIDTVRAMGAEDEILGEYMNKSAAWSAANYRYGLSMRLSEAVTIGITALSTIVIYRDMVTSVSGLTTGKFIGFTTIYACFSGAMNSVAGGIAQIYSMLPMLKNSMEVLRTPAERSGEGEILTTVAGDIQLQNVSFSYNGSDLILKDLSLHIHPGEYVAVVGATGCGKSSLLKLLLGFEEPQRGTILYDGIPLRRLSKPELRRHFGVVLQEDGLFSGTIYKNIVLSKPDCTEEELARVLESVGILEDIKAMPLGLMTPVSEDAHTLSGGQQQRIMLARALIGNPQILFLDEATSALDNITQKIVTDSIQKLPITRVVIAHRLSTIKHCDRILVLNNGIIAEEGTYEELMEKNGIFRKLADNQLMGE